MATIGNSKALVGVIFLQYCSYAIFYLMDEFKDIAPRHYYQFIKDGNKAAKKQENQRESEENEEQEEGDEDDEDQSVDDDDNQQEGGSSKKKGTKKVPQAAPVAAP